MMYSYKDLTQEIEEVIQEMESQSRLHPDWITQSVMNRHSDISGEDTDFFQINARSNVRTEVRKRLNKYKAKPELEADRQIVLEGFERLQKRYLIDEGGEQVAVRIQDLTSKQRRQKAADLRAMGAGCYQHADELDRYDSLMTDANRKAG